MASNFIIRVQLDDVSLVRTQQRLRGLANGVTQQVQLQAAPNASSQAQAIVAQQQRALGQAQSKASQSSKAAAGGFSAERNALRQQEAVLAQAVLAHERLAGTQLKGIQTTKTLGIATSNTVREIARGTLPIRTLGNEILLVGTKVALFSAAAIGIGALVGVFTSLAQAIGDVNDALIGLQRVTSVTGQDFSRGVASRAVIQNMQDLNVSAKDAATAAFEMGKAYGNLNEALAASRTILLANKVAEIDLAQASQQLVQVTQAFGLSGFQQERILDKLNQQQNTLGVNIGKTLEATARASQVTRQAGGTLDQLVARTAVGIRFTGFAPETVARAQARLAQQILGTKGQAQIIKALEGSKIGQSVLEKIILPDDPTQLQNDVDLIFNTIGENFQRFSGPQKNQIAEALTGGRQGGLSVITGALLENFNIVNKQAKESANSQGSALKELKTVLGSIREQARGVGTEFQVLAANVERSGLLGVFGALLAQLKLILKLTNDLLGAFNQLPDAVRFPAGTLAGILALSRLARGRAPGPLGQGIGGLFSSRNFADEVRKRDQALAQETIARQTAARDEAKIRLSAAQSAANVDVSSAREVLAIKEQQIAIERAFREREVQLAKLGAAGQTRINREANALGIVPTGQKAVPEVDVAKQIPRDVVLAKLGLSASTQAAATEATQKKAVADNEAARATQSVIAPMRELQAQELRLAAAFSELITTTALLTASEKGRITGAAATSPFLIPGGAATTEASRSSRLAATLGKLNSPGSALIASLALGTGGSLISGNQQPGRSSVLGGSLQGAGLGLTAGLFTANPFIIGGAALAGGAAGAADAARKNSEESKRRISADASVLNDITSELDDAVQSADKSVSDIKIDEKAARDVDLAAQAKKLNKAATDLISQRAQNIEDTLTGLSFSSSTAIISSLQGNGAQARLSLGDKRANDLKRELESQDLLKPPGSLNTNQQKQQEEIVFRAINERIKSASKNRKELIDLLDEGDRRTVDALRTFSTTDPTRQAKRAKLAGETEQVFRTIVNEFNQGDKDAAIEDLKNLKDNRAAFALFTANASEAQRKAFEEVVNDKSFLGVGEADTAKVKSAVAAIEAAGRQSAQAIQEDSQRLKNAFAVEALEDPSVSINELNDALADAEVTLTDRLGEIVLAVETGQESATRAGREINRLAAAARAQLASARASGDREQINTALQQLQQLQTAIQDQAQQQIDQIEANVQANITKPESGVRQRINVLLGVLSNPSVTRGSDVFRFAQNGVNQALADFVNARIQSIQETFAPQIAAATTDTQRASLLQQQAAQIQQVKGITLQALGLNKQALNQAALAVGSTVDSQRAALADLGVSLVQYAQNILASATAFGQDFFSTVVPEFIQSNQIVQGAVDFIRGISQRASGLLNGAKGALNDAKKGAEGNAAQQLQNQLADQAATLAGPAQQQANQAAADARRAAAEASQQQAAQAAADLLSARFELLKAIARGDDIKVARIGVQQAKAESRNAKTQAERLRAQANIINAEKDLRETILQEKTDQIDFLLETEQITSLQAVARLQKLLKFAKGNKDALRQLKLKIFQLTKEAQNDKTFGLPTEIPLPSVLEIKRIIGVGRRVAEAQATAQLAQGGRPRSVTSGATTTINNQNSITINVKSASDLKKVRKEIDSATGQAVKQNTFIGSVPGLV